MSAIRKRQSNQPEHCPLCYKCLSVRSAAVSHYRAHARRGELAERRAGGWYLPMQPPPWRSDAIYFTRGFAAAYSAFDNRPMAEYATEFITQCWRGHFGRGGLDKGGRQLSVPGAAPDA